MIYISIVLKTTKSHNLVSLPRYHRNLPGIYHLFESYYIVHTESILPLGVAVGVAGMWSGVAGVQVGVWQIAQVSVCVIAAVNVC